MFYTFLFWIGILVSLVAIFGVVVDILQSAGVVDSEDGEDEASNIEKLMGGVFILVLAVGVTVWADKQRKSDAGEESSSSDKMEVSEQKENDISDVISIKNGRSFTNKDISWFERDANLRVEELGAADSEKTESLNLRVSNGWLSIIRKNSTVSTQISPWSSPTTSCIGGETDNEFLPRILICKAQRDKEVRVGEEISSKTTDYEISEGEIYFTAENTNMIFGKEYFSIKDYEIK